MFGDLVVFHIFTFHSHNWICFLCHDNKIQALYHVSWHILAAHIIFTLKILYEKLQMLKHIQLSFLFKSLERLSFPLKMCNTMWLDLSSGYWRVLLCFPFVREHLVIDKELLSTVISYPGDEKSCVYRWCSYRMTEPQLTWVFCGLESHPYLDWVSSNATVTTAISTTAILNNNKKHIHFHLLKVYNLLKIYTFSFA